jgi:hypothetical protein
VPYIFPFISKSDDWSGLSINQKENIQLSRFCLDSAREIFSEMERLNGRGIFINDLLQSYPRTSIPVYLKQELDKLPYLSTRVLDFLHKEEFMF